MDAHIPATATQAAPQPPQLLQLKPHYWQFTFTAMASPCEVLFKVPAAHTPSIQTLAHQLHTEIQRIEHKYSRYNPTSWVHHINHAQGQRLLLDEETQALIDFAHTCYQLSDGLFDITSGITRHLWTFNGGQAQPNLQAIAQLLPRIGWHRCHWQKPYLRLAADTEIDLGGIGKEYAADRALGLLTQWAQQHGQEAAFLVNLGGDISCYSHPNSAEPWHIGLPQAPHTTPQPPLALFSGGVATSGDTYRYLWYQGQKLSHIINPKTGWPVAGAPCLVTIVANNCTQAGLLATLAMLQGEQAEAFLQQEGCLSFVVRSGEGVQT